MKQTKKLIIDIKKAIEVHNEKNPDSKIDKKALAEKLGLTYQSLTNYQGGRIPEIVGNINEIINLTGVSFSDLVKHKQ